jgi:5-methylcytosine-specific restriction enzyme subunit McrC
MRKNIIRVAEFEKLYYEEDKPFKYIHWQALFNYQEACMKKDNRASFYNILNKGVQFLNYVGVIQAGNLTIEILPKTDRHTTTASNQVVELLDMQDAKQRQNWHDVLLHMLKECKLINIHHVDQAKLHLKHGSILDIYIELFLTNTEKIMHGGLVKTYRKTEGNKLALKGQLIISRNISQNIAHNERFYVAYTDYSRWNVYNQIIYKTLKTIPALTNSQTLLGEAKKLLLYFPYMPDCKVSLNLFDKLTFNRKTDRYRDVLQICKLLLLNYRPDIKGGTKDVIAILFDMNKLWEDFVFRRLIKCAPTGVLITRHEKRSFWNNVTDGFNKYVKPDIVIEKDNQKFILDTKWKILANNTPGDEDLKQMFVYNLLWDAHIAMLVYPGNQSACNGSYPHFPLSSKNVSSNEKVGSPYYNHCHLHFINVLNEDGSIIGREPFEELLRILR